MKTFIKWNATVFLVCINFLPLIAQTTDALKSTMNYDPAKMFQSDQTQLSQTRKISVSVTGAVENPGSYIFNSSDRVDRAIQMAEQYELLLKQDKIDKNSPSEIFERKLDKFEPDNVNISDIKEKPRRNILLYRRTGEVIKVDIPKYYVTKDERWNPFLFDGDIIFVPRFDKKKDLFAIYGGVNVPGQIEYSEGDRITDAIQLAYGFTSRAMVDSIILYRYNDDNISMEEKVLRWMELHKSIEMNIFLKPGDRIIIPEREDLREDYHVEISGEIHFPGIYPIIREQTKLSMIIQKAGGVTNNASLKAATVYRNEISPKNLRMEQIMSMRGNTLLEDTVNFIIENEIRLNRGVTRVDFEKLINDHDMTQDIVLRAGDIINIPSMLKTVYVFGQVVVPGNVTFVKGESAEYYIKKAGGFTEHARSGDVMIIKHSSRQWMLPSETELEDGDYIWVPKDPDRPFSYYLNMIGQAASIISVAVSILLLTIQSRN